MHIGGHHGRCSGDSLLDDRIGHDLVLDDRSGRRAAVRRSNCRRALVSRVDAELCALLLGQVIQREAAEDVVHDRLRHPHIGIVGKAGRLELHVDELRDEGLQRHTVLQRD